MRDGYTYTFAGDPSKMDWAFWPWQRCRAVLEPNKTGFHGRCERKRHGSKFHALERGMEYPMWHTELVR